MKNRIKACVISFCILLCGCGASDTGAYLLATQETESQIPTESEALVPDTEVVSEGKEAPLLVYVCGEVMTPGVYELAAGARVCDAVEAAGGFTKRASKDYWNLAEPLTDGQMISFPTKEEAAEREKYDTSDADTDSQADRTVADEADAGGRININTAGVDLLTKLSGIGQTRAEAIIAYRDEHGNFSRVEDIMKVSGIKNALFEKMRDDITVD